MTDITPVVEPQKAGFLTGSDGTPSSMRLAVILSVAVALSTWTAAVVIAAFNGKPIDSQVVMGTIGILGVALGGKAIQTFAEVKK